jgi:hypothetical protein
MRTAVALMLEGDTISHINWLTEQLAHQRKETVSRSDAVAWLVKRHRRKLQSRKTSAVEVASVIQI